MYAINVGAAYDDQCRDFWVEENACDGADAALPLDFGAEEACHDYTGYAVSTRYCLYGPATGYQIPACFSRAVMDWFEGFQARAAANAYSAMGSNSGAASGSAGSVLSAGV